MDGFIFILMVFNIITIIVNMLFFINHLGCSYFTQVKEIIITLVWLLLLVFHSVAFVKFTLFLRSLTVS